MHHKQGEKNTVTVVQIKWSSHMSLERQQEEKTKNRFCFFFFCTLISLSLSERHTATKKSKEGNMWWIDSDRTSYFRRKPNKYQNITFYGWFLWICFYYQLQDISSYARWSLLPNYICSLHMCSVTILEPFMKMHSNSEPRAIKSLQTIVY